MFRIYAIHHQFRVSPVRLFLSVLSIIWNRLYGVRQQIMNKITYYFY